MTDLIGSIYCEKDLCTWEVYTDGRAYSDSNGAEGNPKCAYRDSSGIWLSTLTATHGKPVNATSKLEDMFTSTIAGMIVGGPVDPLRHLRRRR